MRRAGAGARGWVVSFSLLGSWSWWVAVPYACRVGRVGKSYVASMVSRGDRVGVVVGAGRVPRCELARRGTRVTVAPLPLS